MVLIGDSGSSKTDWAMTGGQVWQTQGLNPYYLERSALVRVLREEVWPRLPSPEAIYFYGAGCKAPERQLVMQEVFAEVFGIQAFVFTDMLGAARALFGNKSGIACILGTGANGCLVENGQILADMPSNGIWLGDEGSGGHLGKLLITAYLNHDMPLDLREALERFTADRRNDMIDKVYRQPMPNTYLASFAPFLAKNLKNEWVKALVTGAFEQFFFRLRQHLPQSEKLPISLVGSIAKHFAQPLGVMARQCGLQPERILPRPIEALAVWHGIDFGKKK